MAVAGCQPEPGPTEPKPVPADPAPSPAGTSSHTLTAVPEEEAVAVGLSAQEDRSFLGVLTTRSLQAPQYFHFDAFVVTARESGQVTIMSDVLEVGPNGYIHGYGYPLTIGAIEEGAMLTQIGGDYVQNALETGTAVLQYPVQKGRQYILAYKTFSGFMPLSYRLWLSPYLKMEGRIETLPAPVPVTGDNTGQISLENPRPATLSRIVDWLGPRMGGS
ncbi:Hypothetical protein AA314_08105 [Archangium gephyra]|uniref:Uncharacterized protein n=1 Tax=Archangium gephyra TaxID=48 RepID=A0AAC8QFH1_9BACT|nr:Hypothetical protein AA314_08105 [Archangium gephyra]